MDQQREFNITDVVIHGGEEVKDYPATELPPGVEPQFPGSDAPDDGQDSTDGHIENQEFRANELKSDEGILSVVVAAGDEQIGDIFIGLQVETHIGQSTLCIAKHNDLLDKAGRWLHDVLTEITPEGTRFDVRINARPCPKHPHAMQIHQAVRSLRGEHAVAERQVGQLGIEHNHTQRHE